MDIEFKEGSVCFAGGEFHYAEKYKGLVKNANGYRSKVSDIVSLDDFQLNTIKQGDYIEASEFDTEDKYNRAVEALGLFGFSTYERNSAEALRRANEVFVADSEGTFIGASSDWIEAERKITFNQLMAIGELKRLMNERDSIKRQSEYCRCIQVEVGNHSAKPNSSVSKVNRDIERTANNDQVKNKSKQAYEILESLDYDYDLVKQKWFRKDNLVASFYLWGCDETNDNKENAG